MARRRFTFPRPLLLAGALLFAWWFVPAAFRSLVRASFYEFQAPAWAAGSVVTDLQEYWGLRNRPRVELVEAGQSLARLNAAYELRLQETESLRAEVARLESLLYLPPEPEFRYEVARVIRRDLNAWWQQLVVRKGSRHGVVVNAAVVYAGGVVGRVREVHEYTCVVELVSSPTFRMAAHFDRDDRPVTYQGEVNLGLTAPDGRVFNVSADVKASITEPRRLVSSRLGGIFPDGWTIGLVEELQISPDGLFQQARVRLDDRLLRLREVAILIPVRTSEPGR